MKKQFTLILWIFHLDFDLDLDLDCLLSTFVSDLGHLQQVVNSLVFVSKSRAETVTVFSVISNLINNVLLISFRILF